MIIIRGSDKRPLSLAPETETEAKVQEIWILLCTVLGECPLYRDFGVSNDYLHMPVDAAKTAMTVAIVEAFKKYAPDVELVSISFEKSLDKTMQGILNPVLEVSDIE
jgi:phage baseplate assembly protein W